MDSEVNNNIVIRRLTLITTLLSVMLFGYTFPAKAQRDIQVSQHMFNRTYYNPAATGASSTINAFLLAREQWTNWEGAPSTQVAAVHSYFPTLQSGFGLNFINDKAGMEKMQIGKLMYAFHLIINENSYLSMGLGAGICYQSIDYSKQNAKDPGDPNLTWERVSKYNPDFDLGVEYNVERLKVGVSVTHINRLPANDNPQSTAMHFYGYIRYDIPLNDDWTIKPSVFSQISKKAVQFEGGSLVNYKQMVWAGAFFRMDKRANPESLVFMLGVNIANYVKIGYSYDKNIGYIGGYTGGTHEVFLNVQLPHQQTRAKYYNKTPRFLE